MVEFENRTLNRHILETASCEHSKMVKREHFSTLFWSESDGFLGCRYISLASKSSNEFFTVKFPIVFKLSRHRKSASSNFATVKFFTVFKMCWYYVNAV